MKKITLLLLLLLAVMACKNNGNQISVAGQETTPTGSAMPAQLPPDVREAKLLTSRFWIFEHFVIPDNMELTKKNKGHWYRFYEDGTYDGGHWQDHNDHGTWFLKKGDRYMMLYVDSEINDFKDAEFEMQAISQMEDAMSWVKTANYGDGQSAMCKLIPMLSMPSKKQFGIAEDM